MDTEVTRLQKLRGYKNYGITEVTGLRKLHDNRNYGFTEVTIAGFHSRDQQPCFSTKTKGSVCIIIQLNSQRIWSGHQHGRLFFV